MKHYPYKKYAAWCCTILFFLFQTTDISGQNSIRGLVRGETSEVSYANVILFQARDSAFVKGGISEENGSFTFDNIADGSYYITASMMGFVNVSTKVFALSGGREHKVPDIVLAEQVVLDEVVVKADKPMFQQKVDRMVINVESSILSSGSTALEVLERSPGVTVNRQSNSIALVGKSGVNVMINGKISYLPQEAVVQLLEGMSSDNIETIELITTPPANLDAEGNAGYINIVMKKRTDVGLNGSYSLSFGVGNGTTTNDNINFNYRKDKINIFGNYSFQRRAQEQVWLFDRSLTEGEDIHYVSTVTARDPVQRNHNARLGFDYQISEKTIAGIILSGYDNRWSMDALTDSYESLNGDPILFTDINLYEVNQWKNFGINLNVKHNFKKDGYFSIDYDYLHYDNENPTDYTNDYYDAEGNFLYQELIKSSKVTPIKISVVAGDYSNQMNEKAKLELGVKGAFTTFENDVAVEYFDGEDFVEDPSLTSKSNLDERILAAYTSLDYKFSDKFSSKIGLRYEHTVSKLDSDTEGTLVDRSYGEFFPTLYFTYTVNDSLNMNFSYSRRISRPSFSQMAPFVIFIDPNTFFSGNPAVQPAISNALQFATNYRSVIVSVQYTEEKGTIARGELIYDNENDRLIVISENLDHVNTFSATLGLPVKITDWWKTQNTFIYLYTSIEDSNEQRSFSNSQSSFRINSTQSFRITDDLTSEVNLFYQSKSIYGSRMVKERLNVNLGIQKKFSEKWGTLRFNINDIFDSNEFNSSTTLPDQNLFVSASLDFSNRTFLLTYSRTFGNKKAKSLRNRREGAEEERQRIN